MYIGEQASMSIIDFISSDPNLKSIKRQQIKVFFFILKYGDILVSYLYQEVLNSVGFNDEKQKGNFLQL